ncbi:hypothetical protein XAC3810_90043 [Xanthomonas citri pv. citri]|uniref:Uncharacterized protein n=1 Tax=Xanthomonas citri pv. citri TaxID=611301 RepID=A0A0U5FH42_XANCI|nr:hypothetical protein XAC3824_110044 [Xanthomonas citri pv. citri]CEE16416.1 hypothetical protein XAC1083_100043 [Xanthomonas citri pv. citri]CEE17275.1 hypothetical protein XAC902_100044 [Xanthomonas citri pv. citri]CEE26137.1 hypothetical protein XAC908_130038 [Xanthomonas citri pv. citri]CEE42377.1 hypothetical protein XAC9322_80043 [Xanthomonas citri pv. citri]
MRLSGTMAERFAFQGCEVDAGEAKRWSVAWQQGLARPPIAGHTPQLRPAIGEGTAHSTLRVCCRAWSARHHGTRGKEVPVQRTVWSAWGTACSTCWLPLWKQCRN